MTEKVINQFDADDRFLFMCPSEAHARGETAKTNISNHNEQLTNRAGLVYNFGDLESNYFVNRSKTLLYSLIQCARVNLSSNFPDTIYCAILVYIQQKTPEISMHVKTLTVSTHVRNALQSRIYTRVPSIPSGVTELLHCKESKSIVVQNSA